MRRVVLTLAALAIAVPSVGHAAGSLVVPPPWTLGSNNQGADSGDQYMLDPASGSMTLLRLGGAVNQNLGCAAFGPFANFEMTYAGTNVVQSVTAHFEKALVDPYTWLHIGVYKNGHFIDSYDPRGPFLGSGDLTIDLSPLTNHSIRSDVKGPFTVEFGLNVASACPSVDGGTLDFTTVTVSF